MNRGQMPPCTDTERVAYLTKFVPAAHVEGMKAATRVYAEFNHRAREVMLLLMLESWTAAIQFVIEEYGNEEVEEAEGVQDKGGDDTSGTP